MLTKVVHHESNDIHFQNEQLRKVIQKQRDTIQDLQYTLSIVKADYDNLMKIIQEKNSSSNTEPPADRPDQAHLRLRDIYNGPTPPPRSPFRSNMPKDVLSSSPLSPAAETYQPPHRSFESRNAFTLPSRPRNHGNKNINLSFTTPPQLPGAALGDVPAVIDDASSSSPPLSLNVAKPYVYLPEPISSNGKAAGDAASHPSSVQDASFGGSTSTSSSTSTANSTVSGHAQNGTNYGDPKTFDCLDLLPVADPDPGRTSSGPPTTPRPGDIPSSPAYHEMSVSPSLPPVSTSCPKEEPNHSAPLSVQPPPHPIFPTTTQPQETIQPDFMNGIQVNVISAMLVKNDTGNDEPRFLISIGKGAEKELWRVSKSYSDFVILIQALRSKNNQNDAVAKLAAILDHTMFKNSSLDQQKTTVQNFLQQAIFLPLDNEAELCQFMSTDVIDSQSAQISPHVQPVQTIYPTQPTQPVPLPQTGEQSPAIHPSPPSLQSNITKQGYLMTRSKHSSEWEMRFFAIDNSYLKCYVNEGGPFLGMIRLSRSQIGIPSPNSSGRTDELNLLRFAILIIEPSSSDPSVVRKHTLCAHSDPERDGWLRALCHAAELGNRHLEKIKREEAAAKAKQDTIPRATPPFTQSQDSISSGQDNKHTKSYPPPSPQGSSHSTSSSHGPQPHPQTSTDRVQAAAHQTASTSHDDRRDKQGAYLRVPWGKKKSERIHMTEEPKRIFGVPLERAVYISKVVEGFDLPAIVYYCIMFLEDNGAIQEEGIYRISGSAGAVDRLKKEFNEGKKSYTSLIDPTLDVHQVSGLFKLWLRELPESILTHELQGEFAEVSDLNGESERVHRLSMLVGRLPLANYTLLRTLSAHLSRVVMHSKVNKMTLSNIHIIFCATLSISPGIFDLFVVYFRIIFNAENANSTQYSNEAPEKLLLLENQIRDTIALHPDADKLSVDQTHSLDASPTSSRGPTPIASVSSTLRHL